MSKTVIYHNPSCSKSRAALSILTDAGLDPEIVLYKKVGWDRDVLVSLIAEAGLAPRDALRTSDKKPLAEATDDAIIDAMINDPAIVERPFVATVNGARLCRPTEVIYDILSDLKP